jgi:hypothetical protein
VSQKQKRCHQREPITFLCHILRQNPSSALEERKDEEKEKAGIDPMYEDACHMIPNWIKTKDIVLEGKKYMHERTIIATPI